MKDLRLVLYSPYSVLNIKIEDRDNPLDRPEVATFLQLPLVKLYGVIRAYFWEYDNDLKKGTQTDVKLTISE